MSVQSQGKRSKERERSRESADSVPVAWPAGTTAPATEEIAHGAVQEDFTEEHPESEATGPEEDEQPWRYLHDNPESPDSLFLGCW